MIVKMSIKNLTGKVDVDFTMIKTIYGKFDSMAAMELTGFIYTINN